MLQRAVSFDPCNHPWGGQRGWRNRVHRVKGQGPFLRSPSVRRPSPAPKATSHPPPGPAPAPLLVRSCSFDLLLPTTEQAASHPNTHKLCSDACRLPLLLSPCLLPSCFWAGQESRLVWPLLLATALWRRLELCVFPRGYKQMDIFGFFFFLNFWLLTNSYKNPLTPQVRALTL